MDTYMYLNITTIQQLIIASNVEIYTYLHINTYRKKKSALKYRNIHIYTYLHISRKKNIFKINSNLNYK